MGHARSGSFWPRVSRSERVALSLMGKGSLGFSDRCSLSRMDLLAVRVALRREAV